MNVEAALHALEGRQGLGNRFGREPDLSGGGEGGGGVQHIVVAGQGQGDQGGDALGGNAEVGDAFFGLQDCSPVIAMLAKAEA